VFACEQTCRLGLIGFLCLAGNAAAQAPFQAADINTTRTGGDYVHRFFATPDAKIAAYAGSVVLGADDGIHGTELWSSDGTPGGTRLVADLCPGSCASFPAGFAIFEGALYFAADDGVHGRELWRSDGTTAGTERVVDLEPGLPGSWPTGLTVVGDHLLFVAGHPREPKRLWRSDGTAAGTVPVLDGMDDPVVTAGSMLLANSTVAFFTASDAAYGYEVWVTDGTEAGTEVLDVVPGSADGITFYRGNQVGYALAGQHLVFVSGSSLWSSDGTPAGTAALPAPPSADPYSPSLLGSTPNLAFARVGEEMWSTDGIGAQRIKSLTSADFVSWYETTALGSTFVFSLSTHSLGTRTSQVWTSDGTEVGTQLAIDLPDSMAEGPYGLAPTPDGKLLLFLLDPTSGTEPWTSDLTTAGTTMLADVASGSASSFQFAAQLQLQIHEAVQVGSANVIRLYDDQGDLELWRLDAGGAERLAINDMTSSTTLPAVDLSVRPFGTLGERLVLRADDGVNGGEPWRTDGTPAGTWMLADLEPGPNGSWPDELTGLGAAMLFTARERLWTSDGSLGNAVELTPPVIPPAQTGQPSQLTGVGGSVYFSRWDGNWPKLWRTDGSPGGTAEVAGDHTTTCCWTESHDFGSRLLFLRGEGPASLWLSDGSGPGTQPLPGSPEVGWPAFSSVAGGRVFFAGVSSAGQELWVSDGVAAAAQVLDVNPGAGHGIHRWLWDFEHLPPKKVAALGEDAVFLADDGAGGEEPWFSDGTPEGTLPLADVYPGARSSDPDQLTSTGDRAFFVADDGVHGRELWSTDGTADGTRLVLDIVAGPTSSVPRNFAAVGRHLLFTAWDATHGAEVWVSDGTPEGTFRLGDIAPGPASSSPVHFTATPTRVYFAANDNVTGFEPWAIGRSALESTPTDFHTVAPCRLFDSRSGSPLGSDNRRVPVAGACGIPASARAIAANVTVTGGTAPGHLVAGAALLPLSATGLVPFAPGRTRAQQVLLRLGYGELDARAVFGSPGTVHLIVDVTGYFQ
jgi:ELWxxDGT repeat protein